MDVNKSYQWLKRLYNYGESGYQDSLYFLEQQNFLKKIQDRLIITNNWISYGQHFQSKHDHLLSFFCFIDDYQKYIVEVSLLSALKMSEVGDIKGIEEFVCNFPKFSGYAVSVLEEIRKGSNSSVTRLEEQLKQKEKQYQTLNSFIFDGPPHYHRVMFYLKHVQAYKQVNITESKVLGEKIDDQWQKGRKISTDFSLAPLKEQSLHTLVPSIPKRKIDHPQLQHIFIHPWNLFVFLCCIVREHFEAQGEQAIRFQVVGDEVDVLLTSSNHQQYRYGSFNEFLLEFCNLNQYQLFPNKLDNLQTIFHNLADRKLLTIVDDEYRLPTKVEDVIYNSRVYIPLIAESKQLRGRLKQWIDELRERQ